MPGVRPRCALARRRGLGGLEGRAALTLCQKKPRGRAPTHAAA